MDQSDQPQANTPQSVPPPPPVPPSSVREEAGQDVGEAPNAEHTIDLEKELGEDIHIAKAAAPIPQVPKAAVAPGASTATLTSEKPAPAQVPPQAQPAAAAVPAPQPAPVIAPPAPPTIPSAAPQPPAPVPPVTQVPVAVIPPIPSTLSTPEKPAPSMPPAPSATPAAPPKAPFRPMEPRSAILPGVVHTVADDASTPRASTGTPVVEELRAQAASPLHPLRTMRADEKSATAAITPAQVPPQAQPAAAAVPAPQPAPVIAPPAPKPEPPISTKMERPVLTKTDGPAPRPFVAPSAFKEIPNVPSAAKPSGAPAIPHISVMHPEAIPGVKPVQATPEPVAKAPATVMPKAPVQEKVEAPVAKTPPPIPENLPGLPKQPTPLKTSPHVDPKVPAATLRTYKTDVEESVKANRTSLVSVAAAEERRRTDSTPSQFTISAPRSSFPWKRLIIGLLSLVFILAGAAAIAYIVMGPPTVEPPTEVQASTIIYVDGSTELQLQGLDHTALINKLAMLRDNAGLSLGLMREFFLTLPATDAATDPEQAGAKRLATTQEVLKILSPNIPDNLSRALQPELIMGAHIFDGNQAFLVLRTDAYQQAVAGMLEWEYAMRAELSPFFDRRPRPRVAGEVAGNSTTTPRVIPSSFVDRVVRNHDARVLYNEAGDIILLYAFLDQRTIAVTTNENTLFELASRLKDPLSSALRDIQ